MPRARNTRLARNRRGVNRPSNNNQLPNVEQEQPVSINRDNTVQQLLNRVQGLEEEIRTLRYQNEESELRRRLLDLSGNTNSSISRSHDQHESIPTVNNENSIEINDNNSMYVQSQRCHKKRHLKTSDIKIPVYSGIQETITPYDFLIELDKYRLAVEYSEEQTLNHVVPLALKGSAFLWYRKMKNKISSWSEFQEKFRREFQNINYVRKMKEELENRFQGSDELLSHFINIIDDYYERIDPTTPQSDRIYRIMANMHPNYRLKMIVHQSEFRNVSDMREVAYAAQNLVAWDNEYKVPTVGPSIEPTLAYRPKENN